jgi:glycosyltransferase involved in cell wall biosynthesis
MVVVVYFNSMSAAGGIERVIASHINFLSEIHQITLLTKDLSPSFYPLSIKVRRESLNVDFTMNMMSRSERIVKIVLSSFWTIVALRQQFKKSLPDVVYVASPLNLLEVFLSGMNIRRILVTEHSSFLSYNWIYKKIILNLYPYVGLLSVPTKMDSKEYMDRGISNSYVPNPLSFYPDQISELSSNWALCVGRLTDDKRHDLLLDIWHLSGIQLLGWKLRIIGKGECEPALQNKILALGLNESVFIEPPTSRIKEKYLESSIFLLSSKAEGFGLVLVEAMACGVPCICFDCPSGPRDIVDDGLTGHLLREGDIDGFVVALRDLAKNPSQRKKLGRRARISVNKFKSEIVNKQFIDRFNEAFDQ